jgi:DNA processing protein
MNGVTWIALSLTDRVGIKTLHALIDHFDGNIDSILSADSRELQKVSGIGPKIAHSISKINVKSVEQAITRWRQAGIHIITLDHPEYPARLRSLDDAPPTLFVKGQWPPTIDKCVAIVGTRNPSAEAQKVTQSLTFRLIERGYRIISGLALGIDSIAHTSTLAIPDGYTIAVLGCGVLNIYPPKHEALAEAIMRRGAVLSELHPQASTSPPYLVARNRIISGLSDAVIVIETSAEGGAMYAARFAQQQKRPLYALESSASGNQALVEAGATVIRSDLSDLPSDLL